MLDFPKPVIVISRCLGFSACRWDGTMIENEMTRRLCGWAECRPVCAEVEIGLGIPRAPIHLVADGDTVRLIQPDTGHDYAEEMRSFCATFISSLDPVDGFILKSKSPTCGTRDVKVFQDSGRSTVTTHGSGFLGTAVLSRFPQLPVEDETRLADARLREHFLTRVFCQARLRQVMARGTMRELVRFHSDQKLLLMAYNQTALQRMNRIVANPDKHRTSEVLLEYASRYYGALARPPRSTSAINVMMMILDYFSDKLSGADKASFLESLARYRSGEIPLSSCIQILQSWVMVYKQTGLQRQSFIYPYPAALI